MNCNYYYEGKLIGNELQLASFILNKHKYLDLFGDLVFQLTPKALKVNEKLLGEIALKGKDAKLKLSNYVKNHGIEYDEDGKAINLEVPAMGVNKFLSMYRHTEGELKGHRIMPEFIQEEYWNRRIESWKNNLDFSEDEEALINEYENDSEFIAKVKAGELTPTEQSMENWKEKILLKWDVQGKVGSALHAVSELFFGKELGVYKFEELTADRVGTIQRWWQTFRNKLDEYGTITYGDFINFDQFKSMVELCEKLRKLLEDKYGPDLTFYPEFVISSELSLPFKYTKTVRGKEREEECKEIIGIIDLLVVDSKGKIHIFDYKTSPKSWDKYSSAKRRGFEYQLAVYDRILQHYGIYTGDGNSNIIPILLTDFKYNGTTDSYDFSGISYEILKNSTKLINIKDVSAKGKDDITSNIDEFLPSDVVLEVTSDNLLEKTQKGLHVWFPTYQLLKNMDDLQIMEMIEKNGGFKPDKNGEYHFKFNYGFGKQIDVPSDSPNPKVEMFSKVKKEIESWTLKKLEMLEAFKDDFELAKASDSHHFEFRRAKTGFGRNSNYLSELISPYCNENYEIVKCPEGFCLGILMLRDTRDDTITVLKLTGAPLDFLHEFIKGRTNINGKYVDDITEDSKGDRSLILKATSGNIEAMEAMVALLHMESNIPRKIREIKVINPYTLKGLVANNKELIYTYRTLMNHENILGEEQNKYAGNDPQIQFISDAERLKLEFAKIIKDSSFGDNPDKFNEIIKPELERLNALDWNIDISKDRLYNELVALSNKLETAYPNKLKKVTRNLSDLTRPENQLYNAIMMTILELKGLNVRLQIKDADNWCQNLKIWKYGWEGLMLENTGNFKSATLNLLTKSFNNVLQKVKDIVNKENVTVRKLVLKLKEEKNFGWVRSNVSGNLTNMYKNMTYVSSDGDFLFVNPNTLSGAEKEFLEHALEVINKNRWPMEAEATLKVWKETGDLRYYRVPLMRASTGSKMSTSDFVGTLKDRMKTFTPKGALKEMLEVALGIFSETDMREWDSREKIYEMNNIFESGETYREKMLIGPNGSSRADDYEHNVETILLAHCYSYNLKKEMDKEMPIIKASALALSMLGAGANPPEGNFNNTIDFIENYVKSAIKRLSLVSEKLRPAQAIVGKAKLVASFLALAFSPILFTYQSIESLWKNCSLIIRKPDGTNAFTVKNMWEAAKDVYKDLFHFNDKPSKCLLINEIYGINDMDAALFALRISSDHGIWTHFTDFAFRFASRPDFYNRMTIFVSQMKNEGVWDAYEVKDGELVYNFDKDIRYSAMKTAPKGSPEYNAAYSKYLAALELFLKEGVTNPDGSELKVGDDLPRAYTNLEALGMKAIADGMYGYYNHENKSMFNSMFLGGLVTLMKTYWSAKKNLYVAPSGAKLMGKWEDYKENGKLLYYAVDDRGEIDLSKPMVTEEDPACSGVKVLKWRGLFLEGIFLTFSKLLSDGYSNGYKATWDAMWNSADENLRTAYRSNIKHLAIDLFFMFLVGNAFLAVMEPWKEEKEKQFNRDPEDFGKALELAAASFVADSVTRSFMDFNFIESIFSPTMDWLPFSFSSLLKLATNTVKYVTTDASFASTVANSSSALRQAKPIIKCIGYNED